MVNFDKEGSSTVIPASKVSCVEDLERGSECVVSWNGANNQYGAKFIVTGNEKIVTVLKPAISYYS